MMDIRMKTILLALCSAVAISSLADNVPQFRYSGLPEERTLLNNVNALIYGGKFIRCALSQQDLPAGVHFALLMEGTSPAEQRQNIIMAFPPFKTERVEFFYRALSGSGELIVGVGNQETYNRKTFQLDSEDRSWKTAVFSDRKTRELGSVTFAFVTDGSPLLFEIAGAKLFSPDGKAQDIIMPNHSPFDMTGVPAPTEKAPALEGRAIIGMGGGYAASSPAIEAVEKIADLFGCDKIAIAPLHNFSSIAKKRNIYVEKGIPLSYQTTEAFEIGGFLATHGGFGENATGFSRNRELDRRKWPHGANYHAGDFCHPAMPEAFKHILDKLSDVGIHDFIMPDVAWWHRSSAGYSKADEKAFREYLLGQDNGVEVADLQGGTRRIKFPEYFERSFGVKLEPALLGLEKFDNFEPSGWHQTAERSPEMRRYRAVFYALRRYGLLRFLDEIGAYGKTKGVNVVAMPINCSCFGQGMARLDGLLAVNFDLCDGNAFNSPESPAYGRPGELSAEAGIFGMIARGMSRGEAVKASGTKLRLIHETGQAGSSIPYRDPRLEYALYYALTGATAADTIQLDFLSSYSHGLPTWEMLSDPAQRFHHSRLVSKIFVIAAFLDVRDMKLLPLANRGEIVSIVRSPDYFAVKNDFGMGDIAWRKLLYPVEFIDRIMLDAPFIDQKTRLVFADGKGHTPAEVNSLSRYLKSGKGRTVVLTPLSAGHKFDGTDILPAYYGEASNINDKKAYAEFGIRSIIGENGKYAFDLEGFQPVAQENQTPLLSKKILANGNRLYIFHREIKPEDKPLLGNILAETGSAPFGKGAEDLLVQRFSLPSGGKAFALFDRRPYLNFAFHSGAGKANLMRYESGLASASITVPGGEGVLYELISGEKKSYSGKELELSTDGKASKLYFLLPETPAGKAELKKLEDRHRFLKQYITEDLLNFLKDNKD